MLELNAFLVKGNVSFSLKRNKSGKFEEALHNKFINLRKISFYCLLISLTLSRHPSLSSIASGTSSRLHPVFAQSCCVKSLL